MIPFPGAQGHAIPMMELARMLAKQGLKITIVNTKHGHHLFAGDNYKSILGENIHLVPLPEHSEQDSSGAVAHTMHTMPGIIEKLIEKLNGSAPEGEKISCIIADRTLGWAMELGKKIGVKRAIFMATAAAVFAITLNIPRLIDDGVIDEEGTPKKNQDIQLSPSMPCLNIFDFPWVRFTDLKLRKVVFEMIVRNNRATELAEWMVCNSTQNLEPGAFDSTPFLPIGPLLRSNRELYPDVSNCLKWLDQQPATSVIYAAFGSTSVFSHTQFKEIALGLELTHKPFLLVVRPGTVNDSEDVYPEGFMKRVGGRAKIVEFAPQMEVLNHPSIACFVSHCGWNSTMEGVSGGVPFLCWPYFGEQFANQSYICDVWKVGLRIEKDDEIGIVTKEEIKNKVEQLVGDAIFRERALSLQEETINSIKEGGSSFKNRNKFVEWIKA